MSIKVFILYDNGKGYTKFVANNLRLAFSGQQILADMLLTSDYKKLKDQEFDRISGFILVPYIKKHRYFSQVISTDLITSSNNTDLDYFKMNILDKNMRKALEELTRIKPNLSGLWGSFVAVYARNGKIDENDAKLNLWIRQHLEKVLEELGLNYSGNGLALNSMTLQNSEQVIREFSKSLGIKLIEF